MVNVKDTFLNKDFNNLLHEKISYLSSDFTDVCKILNKSKEAHFILDETTFAESCNMYLWKMDGQMHASDYLSSKLKIYDKLRMVHFTIHFEMENENKKLVANVRQVLQLRNTDYFNDLQIGVGQQNELLTTNK